MKQKFWSPGSWQACPILQQPNWPDLDEYRGILVQLKRLPALVFAGECRTLQQELADASVGNAFVLQCGDCAEDFASCHGPRIHSMLKVILQMAIILSYTGEKPVVTVGRLAGQYAKPRSSEMENVNGQEILSYRGDMVNSSFPNADARIPDPKRILEGYFRAAATLNLVRAFTQGGYAALNYADAWHRESIPDQPFNVAYQKLLVQIRKGIKFANAMGSAGPSINVDQMTLFTSHEALLLDFEEAMTRIDTTTGDWYDTSAHMLWIGNRTRQLNGAHVEFLRGVNNPIGIKIGSDYSLDEIKQVIDRLNPKNIPGRLSLITRFGHQAISSHLEKLITAVKEEGFQVLWLCDPMHGNTYCTPAGKKTRSFNDILTELQVFFDVHQAMGTIPGGVHLELTSENVTECLGERLLMNDDELLLNYMSNCDPRLNAEQSVEIAFRIADLLEKAGS